MKSKKNIELIFENVFSEISFFAKKRFDLIRFLFRDSSFDKR